MYCVYGNSSWYIHGGPLFGGGPLLGGSVIGGSIVFVFYNQRSNYSRIKSLTGNINGNIETRSQLTHTTQLCRDPDGVKS